MRLRRPLGPVWHRPPSNKVSPKSTNPESFSCPFTFPHHRCANRFQTVELDSRFRGNDDIHGGAPNAFIPAKAGIHRWVPVSV
jgi:hypothetical protein